MVSAIARTLRRCFEEKHRHEYFVAANSSKLPLASYLASR
jgi:hypothetical protein